MLQNLEIVWEARSNFREGALVTLQLTGISIAFGLIGGSLIGIARLAPSRFVRTAAGVYIDFFRGTPLLVQLFMIYFGFPALVRSFGLPLTFDDYQWNAAITALSLNSAAYIAEIVRAGIQSIELGQREASESLGLNPVQTMCYVIFPQAFRRIIPPLGNEFISMLKDTSLVTVIGLQELFREGQLLVARTFRPFEVYFAIALVYLSLTLASARMFSLLEWWMNPIERKKQSTATVDRDDQLA